MRNTGLVIKHEILTMLGRPSFWLTTFLMPMLIMGFSFGARFMGEQALMEAPEILTTAPAQATEVLAIGYVDYAGLLKALPEGIPASRVRAFPDELAAQAALEDGELSQYYVIPVDYLQTGDLLVVESEFSPLGNLTTVDLFNDIVTYNLLGDQALADLVENPTARLETRPLQVRVAEGAPEGEAAQYIVSFAVLFLFFFVLTMSSGFMLRSVSREKENRTVEVLLLSLSPRELMLGKVLGLGAVALLQMAIWLVGSGTVLQQGGAVLEAFGVLGAQGIGLPEGFIVWGLLYFVLGYVLYASLLGAIGALAPSARETGQFTFMAMFPLMLPLWLNSVFTESPHSTLAVVLSLFPLTAPTAMLPRLATGGVPFWQPAAGLAGLALATYVFVSLSARFFRADTLLSSAALNWKRVVAELRK